MQLQGNKEQDRIMDPESMTHSALRVLHVGTCCRKRGKERKRKVGRSLQKMKIYILNKYTLILTSQEYVTP